MLARVKSRIPSVTVRALRCGFSASYSVATKKASTSSDDQLYTDLPRPPRTKSERKPHPTPMKVLIRRAKEEREARKLQPCRMLENPPDNGLLVPELIPVAHHIYRARESLLKGLSELVRSIPVQRCCFCSEVHVGHTGHEIRTCTGPKSGLRSATHVWRKGGVHDVVSFPKCFHLYDRVGKPRVGHDERRSIPRIPAVLELCVQAGVDLHKYPCKRRTKPVYCIEGRIVDFETVAQADEIQDEAHFPDPVPGYDIRTSVDAEQLENDSTDEVKSLKELSGETLELWFEMVRGAKQIMESYTVWTCGYCPEVQVGPKGHKVRMCKASRHQSRNGLHAWQEATIYDVIGHNYVWHVRDLNGSALDNNLKRFYGKAPAIVELCVHGGASIPDEFRSMMRVDVVPPDRDEVDLVA
ncbi:APO protein 3, mitochondrial [Punica granatum]|uniref:APO domain-containing protein n=2 Tax=Punica granatum TaxID=22663 RepID=A0A218XLC1_PUNGR|nr:APO protein 3, mitochondrial [Punica granatum]OWM85684.1 hypothetical protein CDL15_Pgr029107 [Punica granatum]PKI70125.1 hypothetical protein CRG98_009457 [Punica granatum]